jgi:phage/plasmid-like protein (TIGR03299 family)
MENYTTLDEERSGMSTYDRGEVGDGGFEFGIVNSVQAWHGLATVHDTETEGPLTPEIALKKSGLDVEVEKRKVYYGGSHVLDKYFTVRASDREVLGIVGKNYTVIQNSEGFSALTSLVDDGDIIIESAISLRGGRTIAIAARRPDHVLIGGEEIIPYLVFANSHDGRTPAMMLTTPERVVCKNTLRAAIAQSQDEEGYGGIHKVRHTKTAFNRLAEARAALGISFDYIDNFVVMGEQLVNTKLSDNDFANFLKALKPIPAPEHVTTEDGVMRVKNQRGITIAEKVQEDIREVYYGEENLNDIRGTAWGAWNAVTQYEDWYKVYRTEDKKLEQKIYGSEFKQQALEILRAR